MQYRRANIEGGTYFFTVNLAERNRSLLVEHVDVLRVAVKEAKQRHPFHIDAFVVLPDHLHAMWTLPQSDADFATRWMLIKTGFSRRIPKTERRNASRMKKGERGIWQRRYSAIAPGIALPRASMHSREHLTRDDLDYEKHVDYIHYNPVKHEHVSRAVDWPHSSIHRYIAAGMMTSNGGGDDNVNEGDGYGE